MSAPSILSSQRLDSMQHQQKKVNTLLYGYSGTGKTHTIYTARQPIYCQSFDPGGSNLRHVAKMVSEGKAIVNRDCENGTAENPCAFELFNKNFIELYRAKAFDHIGTYAIDSLTFLSDAVMNAVLKSHGRTFSNPQIQDYGEVSSILKEIMLKCTNLPCDFILTGHITTEKDEVNLDITTSLISQGKKIAVKLPSYFDEYYVTGTSKNKQTGKTDYQVLTQPDRRYMARTRIGSGVFEPYETPDLMALRRKAGLPSTHLPPITGDPNDKKLT